MNNGDFFFLIFLGTIAITRALLATNKLGHPSIKSFRLRHYMYGVILIVFAFIIKNITIYAIALGLIVDEIPPILVKGPGNKDERWRGCEDYYTSWTVAGVLILTFLVYIFRDSIAGLI